MRMGLAPTAGIVSTISASGRQCGNPGAAIAGRDTNLPRQAGTHDRRDSPSGRSDSFVRLIGQWLTERLGQPLVIENRPGREARSDRWIRWCQSFAALFMWRSAARRALRDTSHNLVGYA